MKLCLLIKYVGTSFEGFQAQPSGNTVQQHLTSAVSKILGEGTSVTGCSRTDSGVHANGFVATVTPPDGRPCTVPPQKLHRALRQYLHPDIGIIGAAEVPDEFHPRYDALGKEYVYFFKDSPAYDPFHQNRVWQLRGLISSYDISRMNEICRMFEGKHDFAGFMSKGSSVIDTVRDVKYANVIRDGDIIKFTVAADGFLYNMVRIMAGTLIGSVTGENINVKKALEQCSRSDLGITAPPEGLYLNRVFYKEPINFLCE